MLVSSVLRPGAVPVPRWILALRALQLLFALLVIGLASYCFSTNGGGVARPALIPTLIIAVLTLLPILPLTTPLHPQQRRLFDPRAALAADLAAALFWLAAATALACYLHVFVQGARVRYTDYGAAYDVAVTVDVYGAREWRVWRCGVAACVFGAAEFVLFLHTLLVFVYRYHLHLCGIVPNDPPRDGGARASGVAEPIPMTTILENGPSPAFERKEEGGVAESPVVGSGMGRGGHARTAGVV